MSPADAAKLLDLPADASPEQLEARFHELRTKLEEKIGKAPTPGLKAKYRESLDEITQAFETLTLAADSSALPVTQKQGAGSREPGTGRPAPIDSAPSSPLQAPRSGGRKSGGKEFALVAIIAVVVLAGGGWFVLKTRAENAEKTRIAAEQKAEAERLAEAKRKTAEEDKLRAATAEKAERERQDRLLVQLRSRMAELNVGIDAALRSEQTAERDLNELKSQERDLKGTDSLEARRLAAQVRAQDRYMRWLREFLPSHPVRVARARTEELISARAVDDAGPAVDGYATALTQMQADLVQQRPDLAAVAAAVKAPALPPVAKKLRPDGLQRNLSYLAGLLYPYEQPELHDIRNRILYDDLTQVLFPQLESWRSKLGNLKEVTEKQLSTHTVQEMQLREVISKELANGRAVLQAIDTNQPLDLSVQQNPNVKALIMVRWQILNIREQTIQGWLYFGVPSP